MLESPFNEVRALKNFAISTEKHLCWSLCLIKLHALNVINFVNRDTNSGVFL